MFYFQALVRMKALVDRCIVEERVISRFRKCNENLTNEQDQYQDALRTLNKEVKKLTEKLKEEGRQKKKEQEAKATVEKEMTTLPGQVDTTRVDAVTKFKASQPFIDACTSYYRDEFEDCLKQVKSIYLHLDLSKISMDDPLSSTPADDTIFQETNDSTRAPKNNGVILTQPAMEKPVTPMIPSADAQDDEDPPTQDVEDLPKVNENPQDAPALNQILFLMIICIFNLTFRQC